MQLSDIWERPIWALKQLLPLRYETEYHDKEGKWFCIWKMWLGECFNTRYYKLAS